MKNYVHDIVPKLKLWLICIGRTNDCSTCQGGSWGTCAPDELECQAGGVPWYNQDTCGGDDYISAGANGCAKCPHLRAICATTCNWCTPNGVTTTKPKSVLARAKIGNIFRKNVVNY